MKGFWNNLIMVSILMHSIEIPAIILNITHLLVSFWTPHKSIDLNNAVNNLFVLPDSNKIIRHKSIVWKTYENLAIKIKSVLFYEKRTT